MFAVKLFGEMMRLQLCAEVGWVMMAKRLVDGGAVETAVEQALMRGLVTA